MSVIFNKEIKLKFKKFDSFKIATNLKEKSHSKDVNIWKF
jgi:hypothetical protein